MSSRSDLYSGDLLFLAIISLVAFPLFLGAAPLFDWDEINFAECAREMIKSGNYLQVQINFQPFWEKPPLFIWLQVLSMKVFGVNEFAARFPNAIIGFLTITTLYINGLRLKGRLFARVLAALYLSSLLPVIYFKTAIIDPTFNFFIFLALFQIFEFELKRTKDREASKQSSQPYFIGFWLGLAVMTKGPAAIVVVAITYFVFKLLQDRLNLPWLALFKALIVLLITVFAWYGTETLVHGTWFLEKFFKYQLELLTQPVAGHEQPFYYHFVIFTLACFPISIFVYRAMFVKWETPEDTMLKRFMNTWFWTVMIIFSLSQTKIVHYSSLLYFPAAFLSAMYITQLIQKQEKVRWESHLIYALVVILWGVLPSCINLIVNHLDMLIPYINDDFAKGNLTMEVQWTSWEWLIGGIFLVGLLINWSHLIGRRYITFLYLQIALTLFFVNGQYKVLLPRIARYTQGAAQDFFTNLVGKDVYYEKANYHSYIPFFYGKIEPASRPEVYQPLWLIEGECDKDVYLSVKNVGLDDHTRLILKDFDKLYEKGGFVFFVKKAKK